MSVLHHFHLASFGGESLRAIAGLYRDEINGQPLVALPAPPRPGAPSWDPPQARRGGNKSVRDGTRAAAVALASYADEDRIDGRLTARDLARRAADHAMRHGLQDAELVDPDGSVLRQMAAALLRAKACRCGTISTLKWPKSIA